MRSKELQMKKKLLRNSIFYAVAIFFAIATGSLIYKLYIENKYTIALNITKSLPDYFYIIDNKASLNDLTNGQTISFKFDVKNDRYYEHKHNFIKTIKCKEGDYLQNDNGLFKCNDKIIGVAMPTDSQGRAVDNFIFNGKIEKDKYFVMGTAANSYDSRYWGFVDRKNITGVIIW